MNQKIGYFILSLPLFLAMFLGSCGHKKPAGPVLYNADLPTVVEGQGMVTKAGAFMQVLKTAYDSMKVVDEYNSLKAINNYNILEENLGYLTQMVDSIQKRPYSETDLQDQIIGLKAQISYMNTLIASGKAILSGDSQSFGTWSDEKNPKK